ncbi:MAG: aldo/keto reductase [Anaerolineales bacterium]|nr:aldo/keto reductase [Anaerolineales bacterium]
MDYVRLGTTGLKVSRLCLGMMTYGDTAWRDWVLGEAASLPLIRQAYEAGVNFFDTADMYSLGVSEEITGRALKALAPRDELVIATKVYNPMGPGPNQRGLSRKHILAGIDDSLRRLAVDYVDLYQIHRWDTETPIEETMEALNDVVRAGKARYIGASSMYAWQFAKAQHVAERHGWARFVTMQNHYNLVYREEEREMIPLCLDQGVGLIPWSPLARGFLAGGRRRDKTGETTRASTDVFAHAMYYSDADFDVAERCAAVAARLGVRPAQLALAWLLHKPGVTAPIIGASKAYQIDDAIAALSISLAPDVLAELEAPYVPHKILGH